MLSVSRASLILLLLRLDWVATGRTNASNITTGPIMPDTPTTVRIIKDQSQTERIEILAPGYLELLCTLADPFDGKPDSIQAYWTKDGEEVIQSQVTIQRSTEGFHLQKKFSIHSGNLGNYSCVFFDGKSKVTKTFIIDAPSIKEKRDKPIVAYIGDSTVLTCKTHPAPVHWLWYTVNGSEKVLINVTTTPRYQIQVHKDKSRLTVLSLTKEDSGSYLCAAIYAIGPAEAEVVLRVITFVEPLKPFLAILLEVVIIVFIILMCELQGRRKGTTTVPENGIQKDQAVKVRQEEANGIEEATTRQRKV